MPTHSEWDDICNKVSQLERRVKDLEAFQEKDNGAGSVNRAGWYADNAEASALKANSYLIMCHQESDKVAVNAAKAINAAKKSHLFAVEAAASCARIKNRLKASSSG